MRSLVLLPVMLGAASLASAAPQEPASSQTQAPAVDESASEPKAKPVEPRKICRRESVSGSNVREKICLTAEQWKRLRNS